MEPYADKTLLGHRKGLYQGPYIGAPHTTADDDLLELAGCAADDTGYGVDVIHRGPWPARCE